MALRAVINVMQSVIILRVACDFLGIKVDFKLFRFLILLSESLLSPVRNILLKQSKDKKLRFDISPFVVMVLLYMISIVLKRL